MTTAGTRRRAERNAFDGSIEGLRRRARRGKKRSETDVNNCVRVALAGLDPVRVENALGSGTGTPDVNYVGGWIEDKYLPAWPKKANSIVRVRHYTPEQRAWHIKRCNAGGRVHVVIEVAGEWFVFDGRTAAANLGVHWTRYDMGAFTLLYMSQWDAARFRRFIDRCDSDRVGSRLSS